jgi:hypothetical protein
VRIVEDTTEKLVVKKAESKSWPAMLLACAVFFIGAIIISAMAGGKERASNQGRAPAGLVIFIFPAATIVFYFLDRRENRKALIMDDTVRTAFVVGSKTLIIPYEEIERFGVGESRHFRTVLLELELKGGFRVDSRIDAPRTERENAASIAGQLTARLGRTP